MPCGAKRVGRSGMVCRRREGRRATRYAVRFGMSHESAKKPRHLLVHRRDDVAVSIAAWVLAMRETGEGKVPRMPVDRIAPPGVAVARLELLGEILAADALRGDVLAEGVFPAVTREIEVPSASAGQPVRQTGERWSFEDAL